MLLCTNAATMAVPELFRRAIDALHTGAATAALHRIAGLMVATALLGAAFRTASRILILQAARDAELDLRASLYRRLTALDAPFYREHPPGDLMSRATNDLTQVRLLLGPALLNIVNTVVVYATAVPLMLRIDAPLTLVAFVVYPPALWWLRRLGAALYKRNRAQQEALSQLSESVQENVSAAAMIRAYVVEPEQIRRFGGRNDLLLQRNVELSWLRSSMFRVAGSLAGVGMLAVALAGARDVVAGRLTLGAVVALVEYMAILSGPTFALGWVLSLYQRGLASMARLEQVLDAEPHIVGGPDVVLRRPTPLRAERMQVDYGDGRGVRDISFTLLPGRTLGVVGAIGSGKSTLARALLRLTDLSGGALKYGEQPYGSLSLESIRRLFAYVPQDAALFGKSIFDNVAFGRPEAKADEVFEAIDAAGLSDEVKRFPEGVHTLVGERGVTLSGGQKQRCALARALLCQAPVLLLDDALSAVDTETETRILTSLAQTRPTQTTILVAHRVATVAHADEILLLEEGRVRERGTHAQLMAHNGAYAEMANKQRLAPSEVRAPASAAQDPHGAQ